MTTAISVARLAVITMADDQLSIGEDGEIIATPIEYAVNESGQRLDAPIVQELFSRKPFEQMRGQAAMPTGDSW